MKLGFLTVCLGNIPLKEKAKWASETGFQSLEIACWPRENDRDYSASDIDVAKLTQAEADEIKAYMNEYGLDISSLAYYDNNLDRDPESVLSLMPTLRNVSMRLLCWAPIWSGLSSAETSTRVLRIILTNLRKFSGILSDMLNRKV